MKSYLLSRRDLDFLLFEWLRVTELTKRERFCEHSEDTFADVLRLCEDVATRQARLALTAAVQATLRDGLGMLGIAAPDEM